jgi:lysophospholipase L1-like esterase
MAGVKTPSVEIVYPKPVLTGGSAPITSSCEPRQGTAFPLGTTLVNCSTTDSQQRRAACTFSVTISRSVLTAERFLAFGDSITAGDDGFDVVLSTSFIEEATSYPTGLRLLLQTEFPGQNFTVINAGVPGEPVRCPPVGADTCGVDRLPAELSRHQPQVLMILHGYNDLDDADNVSEVIESTRDLIRIARSRGVPFVFVGTITPGRTPDPGFIPRQRLPEVIAETNAALRSLVPAEGAHLVDTFAAFTGREQALVSGDGLHLTGAGNAVLAETFFARVTQVVPTAEQSPAFVPGAVGGSTTTPAGISTPAPRRMRTP